MDIVQKHQELMDQLTPEQKAKMEELERHNKKREARSERDMIEELMYMNRHQRRALKARMKKLGKGK